MIGLVAALVDRSVTEVVNVTVAVLEVRFTLLYPVHVAIIGEENANIIAAHRAMATIAKIIFFRVFSPPLRFLSYLESCLLSASAVPYGNPDFIRHVERQVGLSIRALK